MYISKLDHSSYLLLCTPSWWTHRTQLGLALVSNWWNQISDRKTKTPVDKPTNNIHAICYLHHWYTTTFLSSNKAGRRWLHQIDGICRRKMSINDFNPISLLKSSIPCLPPALDTPPMNSTNVMQTTFPELFYWRMALVNQNDLRHERSMLYWPIHHMTSVLYAIFIRGDSCHMPYGPNQPDSALKCWSWWK